MNNLLERHFDTAFDAPDGIKRLRELILSLAMQGKLVKQDPKDPPASELLKEIEAEKKRLIKAGKIKQPKILPPIKPEEVPYELPKGWEWVRLGMATDYNGRKNISGDEIDPDTWVLDLEDIEKETSRILNRSKFSERQSKSNKNSFLKGDVLYGKLRPYLDKVVVADCEGVCTTEIVPIVPHKGVNAEFLRWLLKRPAFLNHVSSLVYGVKMPRLGSDDAVMSIHPLPPLAEQHRIVAKIDQLMARCDALEKLRAERDQKRLVVHAAAIRQLLDPASLPSRPQHVQHFLFSHFPELYAVKENVTELRKAILQLAVMGKLVPQDPNDQPASELLKEIEAEKKRLIKAGKIKQPKLFSPIKPEEVPYELPKSWEWVRLGTILCFGPTNGFSPTAVDYETPFRSLTLSATTSGVFKGKFSKFIANEIPDESPLWLEDGDILVQRGNTIEYVGVPAVYRGGSKQFIYPDLMMKLRVFSALSVSYTYWAMSAETSRQYLRSKASGTSSTMPKISQETVRNLPFPLPPLAEQHRIVAKIDQLMALCDAMENQITSATHKQTTLLTALMARI